MTDAERKAELRGYNKGYAAGKRASARSSAELDADRAAYSAYRDAREQFRREAFLSALNATIISGSWQTGGKQWSSQGDYIRGARSIADAAVSNIFDRTR